MNTLVIGIGEIGNPLADILESVYDVSRKDIYNEALGCYEIVHICYPYSNDFIKVTLDYIAQFKPSYCIIHSTVIPGTTQAIQEQTDCHLAYSPVRGRHTTMHENILEYKKFVGSDSRRVSLDVCSYLKLAGFKTRIASSALALEFSKLYETTYTALMIVYAQEIERYCKQLGIEQSEVVKFTKEIPWLPDSEFYPGHIGGHCLIPNVELLRQVKQSDLLDVMMESNKEASTWATGVRKEIRKIK